MGGPYFGGLEAHATDRARGRVREDKEPRVTPKYFRPHVKALGRGTSSNQRRRKRTTIYKEKESGASRRDAWSAATREVERR